MIFTREITSNIEIIKDSRHKIEEVIREAIQENVEGDKKVSWSDIRTEF